MNISPSFPRAFPPIVARLWALLLVLLLPSRAAGGEEPIYDAVVVGGGAAGYAGAISAVQNGAKRVLVLEKRGVPGGRVQTVLVERSTVATLKSLGVDPSDGHYAPVGGLTIERKGRQRTLTPKATLESIAPAEPGARTTGMFVKRAPVAFTSLDDGVESLRRTAAKLPQIEIREGAEVTGVRVKANGDVALDWEHRDARGRVPPGSRQAPQSVSARYVFNASGLSGGPGLLGTEPIRQGPEYPMVTAVFRDQKPGNYGRALITKVEHEGVGYRVLVGGGKRGETSLTMDVPPSVDRKDRSQIEALVKDAVRRSGFFGASESVELVKAPSTYVAQRTRAARPLVGAAGRERIMVGGDALVTGTPWTGLGYNLGVHSGALFGHFYAAAESARTPAQAASARKHVRARLDSQVAWLHGVDRGMHVATGAPQLRGPGGKASLLRDVHATGHDVVRAGRGWASSLAPQVAPRPASAPSRTIRGVRSPIAPIRAPNERP